MSADFDLAIVGSGFDRDTLERVVCLVRRWTCHRLGKLSL